MPRQDSWPTPPRPLADHVRNAVARALQPKLDVPPAGRPPAAHVLAALGAAQAKPGPSPARRPLAPHVEAAAGSALQPKAGVRRIAATSVPPVRPQAPRRIIQRAAAAAAVVVRLPVALSGGYADLYNLLVNYSPNFCKDGRVLRALMIGQALGLPAPENWGHASKGAGSAGEGERGKKNVDLFKQWYTTNKAQINAAEVQEGGGGGGGTGMIDESLHEKKLAAKQEKAAKKKEAWGDQHAQEHVEMGHQEVEWDENASFCKTCGKMFLGL